MISVAALVSKDEVLMGKAEALVSGRDGSLGKEGEEGIDDAPVTESLLHDAFFVDKDFGAVGIAE